MIQRKGRMNPYPCKYEALQVSKLMLCFISICILKVLGLCDCSPEISQCSTGSSVPWPFFADALTVSPFNGVRRNKGSICGGGTRRGSCLHYRSLGDIMAEEDCDDHDVGDGLNDDARTTNGIQHNSGLVTSAGGNLQSQFRIDPPLSPMERIALTANGNLQRIFSSFYDAPVHVNVDYCVRRKQISIAHEDVNGIINRSIYGTNGDSNNGSANGTNGDGDIGSLGDAIWDRVVHISVFGQNFCKATSVITVHSSDCIKCVESGEVGIGQLFRHLDKLPTFNIISAGRCGTGGLWRKYTLESKELTCEILEEFTPNAWEVQPIDDSDCFNGDDNTI